MKVGQKYKVNSKIDEIIEVIHISNKTVWYDKFNKSGIRKSEKLEKALTKIKTGEYILIQDSEQRINVGEIYSARSEFDKKE